jgi:hypothetical protein
MEQRTHEVSFCYILHDWRGLWNGCYISVQMERKRAYMEVRISEAVYNCAVMCDLPCLLMW